MLTLREPKEQASISMVDERNVTETTRTVKLNSFETSSRPRYRGESEHMINPARVGPRRHHSRGEEAFNLGCEKEPVALPCPEKGRDAEPITPKVELAAGLVP